VQFSESWEALPLDDKLALFKRAHDLIQANRHVLIDALRTISAKEAVQGVFLDYIPKIRRLYPDNQLLEACQR
jgi:hypothetical protein